MRGGGRRLPALALMVAAVALIWTAAPGSLVRAQASSGSTPIPSAMPGTDLLSAEAVARESGGKSHLVTLVTGDVVQVNGDGTGEDQSASLVRPRENVQIIHAGDDLYALPSEVGPMLMAGQLDPRLLNLSLLVRDGFTDDQMKQLPVIVSYKSDSTAVQAASEHRLAAATVSRHLDAVHGLAAEVDKKQTGAFLSSLTQPAAPTAGKGPNRAAPLTARPEVAKVWLDGKVKTTDDVSRVTIGADQAWAAGYDGAGQTVAVIDTGIDESHADLAGQVIDKSNFVPAPYPGSDSPTDRFGHGTHVASIIAGTGAMSGGKYAGVAPKARLINAKVLTDDGGYGFDSWIIPGMEWAASKAKIINMSLGACCFADGTDPKAQALNDISKRTGALFVVAAGNSGCSLCVGTPGVADAALTVAATTRDGAEVAGYSSKGPRAGDYALKPEIAAPGSGIVAAGASGSYLCKARGCPGGYLTLSGTSMATPHVAASAAIVRQRHPDWNWQQIKDALTSTARLDAKGDPIWAQGSGLVNAGRAVTQNLHATGILNLGVAKYPQQPGNPLAGTITYTNSGSTPVTLDLAGQYFQNNAAGGQIEWTPPAGAVKIAPAQVVVPAGGSAKATISVDPSQVPLGTSYSQLVGAIRGRVVATAAGGLQVSTTVSFTRDIERYPLKVNAFDVDGSAPGPDSYVTASGGRWLTIPVEGQWWSHKWLDLASGDLVSALPKGTYVLSGELVSPRLDHSVLLGGGWNVQLDQPREMTFDGRQAHEVQLQTERPTINQETYLIVKDARGKTLQSEWYGPGFGMYQLFGPAAASVNFMTRRVPVPLTLRSLDDQEDQPVRVDALLSRVRIPRGPFNPFNEDCGYCPRVLPTSGQITLVDAGDGSPGALAGKDLRGKVALINEASRTDTDWITYTIDDQLTAAAKAGASGVVFAVDSGSPMRFSDYRQPIWVTVVPHADGEKLARMMGRAPLRLQAQANTPEPYLYDLNQTFAASTDGVYKIRQSDLATMQAHYPLTGPVSSDPLDFARWDMESAWGDDWKSFPGFFAFIAPKIHQPIRLPSVRTEYVNAGVAHTKWLGRYSSGRTGWVGGLAPLAGWTARTPALNAGQTIDLEPTVGPLVPGRIMDQPVARNFGTDGGLRFGVYDLSHYGSYPKVKLLGSRDGSGGLQIRGDDERNWQTDRWPQGITLRTRIFNGDAQVCDVPHLFSTMYERLWLLPNDCPINQSGQLRVLVDTTQTLLPNSTSTSTEWKLNFDLQSKTVPLVLAEYKLPVDLRNLAPAGEHQVPVHVGYQPGGPNAPSSWAVKVWATFDDGAAWKPVFDGETADGWVAPEIKPPHGHNGFVGLRVEADDGQGNAIDQTIIRAYTVGSDDRQHDRPHPTE